MNKVILIGTTSAAPELRYTQGGQAVLNLRVETREEWTDKSGVKKESKTWHHVVVWGKRGEELSVLPEGTHVVIEGKLQTSSYEKNGEKRYKTDINAQSVDTPFFHSSTPQTPPAGNQIPFGAPPQDAFGTAGIEPMDIY